MHFSFSLLLLGLTALTVFKLVSSIVTSYRRAAKAKAWGCEPAPQSTDHGFLGIKLIRRMQEADSKSIFPDFAMTRYNELCEAFGRPASTFRFSLLGRESFSTNDPKNIQAMLATQFDDFELGIMRRRNMIVLLGDGIFVQDGKAWEHSRAMLRPNFIRDQVADLELEERHLQHMMQALPVAKGSQGWTAETDLQTLFFRLTIDSATEFLFGESVNSQLNSLHEDLESANTSSGPTDEKAFGQAFDGSQHHLARRFRLGDLYYLHNPKEFRDQNKRVNLFVDHFVQLALRRDTATEKTTEEGRKAKYVFLENLATRTRDPIELRAQLLNVLLAGRDTTASLLSYLFHHLVRNPDAFAKLRSAIIADFGTYADPQNMSFATLKGCTYLQHCINETLRLNSVVPFNGRMATRDTTLPRGGGADGSKPIFVPKGVQVEYSVHVMHRRKDLWGPDAEEWKPERWVGRRPGWEFLPFNGGPRICIGQQFALVEASYVVVRLLQRFEGIEATGDELTRPVTANLTLTCCPGKGPVVRLKAAEL